MALGTDFAGTTDLDPAMREIGGSRALGQAIVRRLTTALGTLQDHPEYGFDLRTIIGSTLSPSAIAQRVLAQVRAEEEVDEASVDVTKVGESDVVVDIKVVPDDEGEFILTLNVSDVEVTVIIPS